MNKEFEQLKKIEEILARSSMKDGVFLSTWNEKTGAYTVSFEGSDLLEELKSHLISSDEIKREAHEMPINVTCGDANPKGNVSLRYRGSCGHVLDIKDAYRCGGCGGWFHKDCLYKHFEVEKEHDYGKRKAVEDLVEMMIRDHPLGIKAKHWYEAMDWVKKCAKEYLTQQSLDKGDSK